MLVSRFLQGYAYLGADLDWTCRMKTSISLTWAEMESSCFYSAACLWGFWPSSKRLSTASTFVHHNLTFQYNCWDSEWFSLELPASSSSVRDTFCCCKWCCLDVTKLDQVCQKKQKAMWTFSSGSSKKVFCPPKWLVSGESDRLG